MVSRISIADYSELQLSRLAYAAPVPAALSAAASRVVPGDATGAAHRGDEAALKSWFPHTFGQPTVAVEAAAEAAAAPAPAAARRSS